MNILKYYRENISSEWIYNNLLFQNKSIILSSVQKEFIDNECNKMIMPRGSGKTFAIEVNALERLYRNFNEHINIITFSKIAAEDIFNDFFDKFKTKTKSSLNYNKQLMRIYNIKTNSEIVILYPQEIRGQRVPLIFYDDNEIKEVEEKQSYFIDESEFIKRHYQNYYNTYTQMTNSLIKKISSLY